MNHIFAASCNPKNWEKTEVKTKQSELERLTSDSEKEENKTSNRSDRDTYQHTEVDYEYDLMTYSKPQSTSVTNQTTCAETVESQSVDQSVDQSKSADELMLQSDIQGTNLSSQALSYLKELEEKYPNMEFYIRDQYTDEEADAAMGQGSKQYQVWLESDILEQMAVDDSAREFYEGVLSSANDAFDAVDAQFSNSDMQLSSMQLKIYSDGSFEFSAKLTRKTDTENNQKQVQESRQEYIDQKEAQKDRIERMEESFELVHGKTIEELVSKITSSNIE